MSELSKKILSLFRGRHDFIAVANGAAFEPGRIAPCDELVDQHLEGERSFGFYVLTADSKCWCTCVDFDNKPDNPNPDFEKNALALHALLVGCQLQPLLERSQSGNGYHVWLFFSQAVAAYLVRAWWRGCEHKLGFKFREVYPRQEKLTGKGMGSLVRYPLWNKSRFIDPEDEMRELDANEALDGVRRIAPEDLPLLAFQLGMGALAPEPSAMVMVDAGGGDGSMLPLRVQKLLERSHSLLARRWKGDTEGMRDNSNSAVAMSIAVELVRLYVPTPEIASALRYWCRQKGAQKGEREDWINLTVTKAYDFIVTRQEAPSKSETTFEKACLMYIDGMEQGQNSSLPSGVTALDASIDGAGDGEMVVIAARPGHGKSALAFQWLAGAASIGRTGLLISEEMSAKEVGKRRLLSITEEDQEQWRPSMAKSLKAQVTKFHEGSAPVYVVEGCNTIDRVEEVVDQFVTVHGVSLVAIDYLQLLTGRHGDRYEVVTEMSRRMKHIAQRHRIPVLVLAQLNREIEKREGNVPRFSDLRETGQIEQDADLILFLQWPYKINPISPINDYVIFCAKRRNGPIREPVIKTTFNPAKQIIGEYNPGL